MGTPLCYLRRMFHGHKDFAVYQPTEAARFIGISARKIRRWLQGYHYVRNGVEVAQPALWTPEYAEQEDLYLGFRDLIEIRFVESFSRAGLSKQAIRHLLAKAKDWVGQDYPLSTTKFKTDGRTLFLEVWENEEDVDNIRTIDLRDGQHAFRSFVSPSFKDLEFEGGLVTKWYVSGKDQAVAIDPNIAFGQPVIENTGIPTSRIYEAFEAEGDERVVAWQFEVPVAMVRQAINFEKRFAGQQ